MKQIRKNFITNIICLVTNIFIGLLYTPYLIKELGVSTYGILPIVLVINQYIIILTDALQNSVTRFYSVEYRQNNFKKASIFFSSAIAIAIIFALITLIITLLLLPQIKELLNIPNNLQESAGYLVLYAICSLFISVCSNCVNITIYSENRLDLINYLKILRNVAKLIINILLFTLFTTCVSNVGLASLLAELLVLILSIIFYKTTKIKEIKFNYKLINFSSMKPIAKMLTWVLIINFSSVFIYKIDTILMNNYYGLYYTGILGSISEFGSYCISITGVIGILYRPLMLIAYSEGKHSELIKTTIDGSYIVGLMSCLICGIIMGMAPTILKFWLGNEIANYWLWLDIKLFVIPITTFGAIYSIVFNLWNHVKISAILSIIIAIFYVAISIILLNSGISMTYFLIFGAIAAIIQGGVVNIYIYSRIYPQSMKKVYTRVLKCSIFFIIVISISSIICYYINASNIYMLILESLIALVLSLSIVLFFLRKNDIDALDMIVPIKFILNKYNSKNKL